MTVVKRKTKETAIALRLEDGGPARIDTGLPWFDHMLGTLGRYSGLGITLEATGDLRHHLIEDVALTFGRAFRTRCPPTAARYGEATVPMDEVLVQAVVDLGGRPYYRGRLPNALYDHWLRSFAMEAQLTLHVRVLRRGDRHHLIEAAFKAVGLALRKALVRADAVFSTKGSVEWEVSE